MVHLQTPCPGSRNAWTCRCEVLDDGSSYLYADFAVTCHEEDGAWYPPRTIYRLGMVGVILYPIAVPVVYALLLWAARGAIVTQRPTSLSKALNFLHRDVKPRYFWWEVRSLTSSQPGSSAHHRHPLEM